jgi:4-hydroxy-tetrahydrodipicolinate synthase
MARFGRVLSAMVTPFGQDGSLDLEGAVALARWLVDHGNDGLVLAGTTGEAPTLTHEEQIELIEAVVEAVDVPVVAGTGSNDTRAAVELTERATEAGATAVLVVTPYYNRPSQAGIGSHFRTVAGSTDLPVMLYDIPVRAGRKIETDTILELAYDVSNIVALKDAAGNPGETALLISQAPDDFEVYSGDSSLTLPLLSVGAVGVVGVASHWTGAEHQEMFSALDRGDLAGAQKVNADLQASFVFEASAEAPNPIPTKVMMNLIGVEVGGCRPPMDVVPSGLDVAARTVLATTRLGADLGIG